MTVEITTVIDADRQSAIITVTGDLAYGTTDALVAAVSDIAGRARGLRHLRIDMAALDYFDSAGLASLLTAHRHARAVGMQLHLDNRPAQLDRVLDITGMRELLTAPVGEQLADTRRSGPLSGESGLG
jgi:anti-anti-sigma factor